MADSAGCGARSRAVDPGDLLDHRSDLGRGHRCRDRGVQPAQVATMRRQPPSSAVLVAGMAVVAAVALAVAVRAPLSTAVLGLIAFGILHNVLELRYVTGRFAGVLSGRFVALLVILITGIVVCRVLGGYVPGVSRAAEIVLGYLV